jgi:hypothetical protein
VRGGGEREGFFGCGYVAPGIKYYNTKKDFEYLINNHEIPRCLV